MEEELALTRQALAELQERFQAQNVAMATLTAEQAGFQERLRDRAIEIATLSSQLSQAREQFSHYQDAIAAQRDEERRQHDQRIARHEHDLLSANKEIAGLQATLAQRDTTLSSLSVELGGLQNESDSFRQEVQSLQFARDRLVEQLTEAARTRDDASTRVKQLEQALQEIRLSDASHAREITIRTDQLHIALAQLDVLMQEKLSWVQERTLLEQQLEAAKRDKLEQAEARK